jgi:hypothetical protein
MHSAGQFQKRGLHYEFFSNFIETNTSTRFPAADSTVALKWLTEADIRCRTDVSLEYQRPAKRYVLRGRESGGAVKELGRYVGFCGEEGGH